MCLMINTIPSPPADIRDQSCWSGEPEMRSSPQRKFPTVHLKMSFPLGLHMHNVSRRHFGWNRMMNGSMTPVTWWGSWILTITGASGYNSGAVVRFFFCTWYQSDRQTTIIQAPWHCLFCCLLKETYFSVTSTPKNWLLLQWNCPALESSTVMTL